jgi:predicted nucleic acid-binding protein
MKAAVVVDSGVLLALWDTSDPRHHAATAALQRHLDGNRLIVPVTTLAQVLVGAYRATPYAVRTIESFIDDLINEVHPADRPIGRAAARLQANQPTLPLADALLLATGEIVRAQEILTTNPRLEQVDPRVRILTG